MSNKLDDIRAKAAKFADCRSKLQEYVQTMNDAIEQLRRDNLPQIRRALTRAAELQAEISAMVEEAPELFVKPKSVVLHGIQVGFEKGKGKVTFEDADQVVALIEKKLPDLADVLISTVKKPIKKPLQQLTVQQLRSIGCQVEEAGDRVIVRAVDTEVEKLVAALLKGAAVEDAD